MKYIRFILSDSVHQFELFHFVYMRSTYYILKVFTIKVNIKYIYIIYIKYITYKIGSFEL